MMEQTAKPKILVVDDEWPNLTVLAKLLEQDYKVVLAKSGAQALERALTQPPPDLILMDVVMPEMDGYEVLRRLKEAETKDIPVIFITALDSSEEEEKGLLFGAVDYITKPFHPSIVKVRVRNHLTMARQRKLLERLANLDGLTEIPNRRSYEAALGREWRRCLRSVVPLSLAMLDVDNFKQFNDTYGHAAGDEALKTVARVIRYNQKRPGDMAARYGGEEFVLLLPETDAEGARVVAESIRKELEGLEIPHSLSDVKGCLTVSIGGATLVPEDSLRPSELQEKADAMLYQAKRQGKNRVVWARPSPGTP